MRSRAQSDAEPPKVEAAAEVETATADLGAPAPGADRTEEVAQVETATADLGAPSPEADKTAEPEFDEVWFPVGRRPDNPRHEKRQRYQRPATGGAPPGCRGRRRERGQAQHDPGTSAARTATSSRQWQNRPAASTARRRQARQAESSAASAARDDWNEHQPRPRREGALDPDSPWASARRAAQP